MTVRPIEFVRGLITGQRGCGCTACPFVPALVTRKLMLVGSPNVGKSLVFNQLTGSYATVSNYPGTTVEVTRGRARVGDVVLEVVDSPGTYALTPLSEDEQVSQDLLFDERADLVLHVVDAKHLRRMLPLTLQLVEAGLPIALDVNVIDEADRLGMGIDTDALHRALSLPVVATSAANGRGMEHLRAIVSDARPAPSRVLVHYPQPVEAAVARITGLIHKQYGLSARALALLLLQRDLGARARLLASEADAVPQIDLIVSETEALYPQSLALPIAVARQRAADRIAGAALTSAHTSNRPRLTEIVGQLAVHPIAGIPILAAVLLLIYLIVGRLAAGTLVDFLEKRLFLHYINPPVTAFFQHLLPWPTWSSLFVGDYGLITLGVRYALAIVLPLVGAFFLVFAVLEDSGYLPRLALLVDRLFKRIGLSGRAVIPIILGLGCDTMATIVTRVLQTRRERIIATFLLALAIPCSAQLGIILGLLSAHPAGLLIWGGVIAAVFVLSGFLAAHILPGEVSRFYLEIPPLRAPSARNVALKTYTRLKWYAGEVIPLFLLAGVLVWLSQVTHILPLLLAAMRPMVHAIGLPTGAADGFLFGFLRRDYGAARLFDLVSSGVMSGVALVVAMVTITLFIPCLAQLLVMQKERGMKVAALAFAIILPFAFAVGYILNVVLSTLKVRI